MCCLLLHRLPNVLLPKKIYATAFLNNPDGAGFAYIKDKQLVVEKGFMTWPALWAALSQHEGEEMVIHFRAASPNMKVVPEATHPFTWDTNGTFNIGPIEDGKPRYQFAAFHNGYLEGFAEKDKGISDTQGFVDKLLAPHTRMHPSFLDTPTGHFFCRRIIGDLNKVVVFKWDALRERSSIVIVNDSHGPHGKVPKYDFDGCWFSNDSYEEVKYKESYARTGGYYVEGVWQPLDDGPKTRYLWDDATQEYILIEVPAKKRRKQRARDHFNDTIDAAGIKRGWNGQIDYSHPDVLGWKWDYPQDCWVNHRLNRYIEYLHYRSGPVYCDTLFKLTPAYTAKVSARMKALYLVAPNAAPLPLETVLPPTVAAALTASHDDDDDGFLTEEEKEWRLMEQLHGMG